MQTKSACSLNVKTVPLPKPKSLRKRNLQCVFAFGSSHTLQNFMNLSGKPYTHRFRNRKPFYCFRFLYRRNALLYRILLILIFATPTVEAQIQIGGQYYSDLLWGENEILSPEYYNEGSFLRNGSGLYSHRGKKLERRSASFPGKFFIRRKGNSQQRAFQQRSGIPFGKRRNRKQAQSDFHVGRRRAFRSQIFSFSL